jgi:hypothetical protein
LSLTEFLFSTLAPRCAECSFKIRIEDLKRAQKTHSLACPRCGGEFRKKSVILFDKSKVKASNQVQVIRRLNEFQIDIRWLSKASTHTLFLLSFHF